VKQPRAMRSYLAVPAHRMRLVQSAAASPADAVYLDLEDSVPLTEKSAALALAAQALTEIDWGNKWIAVRLNASDSETIAEEIMALGSRPRLDAVILPKAERPAEVAGLADRLRHARGSGMAPLQIELLIETALGLVNIDSLATADPLVTALHFGAGDFAASIGARTRDIGISPAEYRHLEKQGERYRETPLDLFAYPMMRLLVTARAFGLRAIDGPCSAFRDARITEAMAVKVAAMGLDGKQVIHPSQIEPTRNAFVPSSEDIGFARKVLAAMDDAEREGKGAVTVDGKMLDHANVRLARRIILFAEEM
jgi:malyl-CoA/(S)-citramalyl-CoA lyase